MGVGERTAEGTGRVPDPIPCSDDGAALWVGEGNGTTHIGGNIDMIRAIPRTLPDRAVEGKTSAPTQPPTCTIGASPEETSVSRLTLVFLRLISLTGVPDFNTPAPAPTRRKARR